MLPLAPPPALSSLAQPWSWGNPVALLSAALLALTPACVGGEPHEEEVPTGSDTASRELTGLLEPVVEEVARTGVILNGVILNGVILNGLALNGPLSNGLATHGLGTQGLANPDFARWFTAHPEADGDMAMHYLVACAVPSGQRRTWLNPATGTRFSWEGVLGLAPGWAGGQPASEAEQQLVSACLAAMVNKYGFHVPVSVRGKDAAGLELPMASGESTFSVKEAAFFGNLFTGEGLFVCGDRTVLDPAESSVRACGLFSRADGLIEECPPLVHVGLCPWRCEKKVGKSYYERCTVDGRDYLPVTTRLRPQDVYRCGDGVCQVSESCDGSRLGVGTSADNCFADCGLCE